MADKRKLQSEIERCLKKVQEGVETFEDIWQKLHNAANTNQKDKYESDLKKEIKKLQRLRDQIKTWAASNDVKDKKSLLENRKLIETQMERFKVVERETKTKAYSKEGLGLAAKIDPAQKEREITMQWLQQTIDKLLIQTDIFESKIESTTSHSRKKKVDGDKQKQNEELKNLVDRHKFHINKLETLMRMLDNQTIDPGRIKELQDDLEYYTESCEDPDFEENEFIYEDLNLDDTLSSTILPTPSPIEKHLNNSIANSSGAKVDDEDTIKSVTELISSSSPLPISNHSSLSSHNGKEESSELRSRNRSGTTDDILSPRKGSITHSTANSVKSISRSFSTGATTPNKVTQKTSHGQPYAAAAGGHTHAPPANFHASIDLHSNSVDHQGAVKNLAKTLQKPGEKLSSWQMQSTTNSPSVTTTSTEVQNTVNNLLSSVTATTPTMNGPTTVVSDSVILDDSSFSSKMVNDLSSVQQTKPHIPPLISDLQTPGLGEFGKYMNSGFSTSSLKKMAEKAVANAGLDRNENDTTALVQETGNLSLNSNPTKADQIANIIQPPPNLIRQVTAGSGETRMTPLLGVAPLGPIPLSKDNMYQQAMLESSWRHMPHPSDSERLRHYLPRNPCPTPTYYHQSPLPHHDAIDFYLRLSTETLFFIFYYMEASKAQYLAAKALKKQSWRFHTKYMMWFQRHEEPKTITDEYEQGTYIYFDYEKWGQRKKEGFTFEYRYLEDRDLP